MFVFDFLTGESVRLVCARCGRGVEVDPASVGLSLRVARARARLPRLRRFGFLLICGIAAAFWGVGRLAGSGDHGLSAFLVIFVVVGLAETILLSRDNARAAETGQRG